MTSKIKIGLTSVFFLSIFYVFLCINTLSAQIPIAYFDFENNTTRTTFENATEQDINGSTTALTKVGGSSTTVSGLAGAAMIPYYGGTVSGQAASATGWVTTSTDPLSSATNYFQFTCKTTGFSGISVVFDAFPSATNGPNRLNLLYSIDGTTFNSFPAVTASNAFRNNWTSLRYPLALADNQASVTVRIYGFSAANTTTGSLSLDNLEIDATATVPNAGEKTMLNEENIYTSTTSGLTGTVFTRPIFTINTGSRLNLSSQFAVSASGSLTVGAGGTLDIGNYILSGISATATLTVAANATVITSNPTGLQGGVITTNKNFSSDANYEFKGASTGVFTTVPTSNTVNNLIINSGTTVNLDMDLTVNSGLNFTSGKLMLGSKNLIIGASGLINSANATQFIVTNGTGGLTQNLIANTLKIFPIGTSPTQYDPVSITPNAPCSFKAKVAANITPAYTLSPRQTGVVTPRQWDIALISGAPSVTLALTSSDLSRAPAGMSGIIGHWNNTTWDDIAANYSSGTWTATGVTTFSPFIVSQPNTPLSMSLKNFIIEAKNNVHTLAWVAFDERNNAQFNIQHASDDLIFKTIGQIKSMATANNYAETHYTFENNTPSVFRNYYRLEMVDLDGKITYSKTISIQELIKNKPELFPNLATDKITVLTHSDKIEDILIINLEGQIVVNERILNAKELDINGFKNGIYFIKIKDEIIKFFKQ